MRKIGYGNAVTTGGKPFWVEWPTGPVFFALNIDMPNRLGDLAKRQDITRKILRSIKALPPAESGGSVH